MKILQSHTCMIAGLMTLSTIIACEKWDSTTNPSIGNVVTFFSNPTSAIANGVDSVRVTLKSDVDASGQKVSFKTSTGFFKSPERKKEISLAVTKSNEASATVITGLEAKIMLISATIADTTFQTEVTLTKAYADTILTETSSAIVTTDGKKTAIITAYLRRSEGRGKVSIGVPVEFKSQQRNESGQSVPVGRFFNLANSVTDTTGKASIGFAADTGDVRTDEPVVITVTTKGATPRTLRLRVESEQQS
ncbi:hypothetical protein MJD09_01090 [bacterium]|nr:hypothetical protein [bacterium]